MPYYLRTNCMLLYPFNCAVYFNQNLHLVPVIEEKTSAPISYKITLKTIKEIPVNNHPHATHPHTDLHYSHPQTTPLTCAYY